MHSRVFYIYHDKDPNNPTTTNKKLPNITDLEENAPSEDTVYEYLSRENACDYLSEVSSEHLSEDIKWLEQNFMSSNIKIKPQENLNSIYFDLSYEDILNFKSVFINNISKEISNKLHNIKSFISTEIAINTLILKDQSKNTNTNTLDFSYLLDQWKQLDRTSITQELWNIADLAFPRHEIFLLDQDHDLQSLTYFLLNLEFTNLSSKSNIINNSQRIYIIKSYDYHF